MDIIVPCSYEVTGKMITILMRVETKVLMSRAETQNPGQHSQKQPPEGFLNH